MDKMKIKLWVSAKDMGDGSVSVCIINTKEEALDKLNRTEEEVENGCFYEDGMFEEILLDIDENGKLVKPVYITIE